MNNQKHHFVLSLPVIDEIHESDTIKTKGSDIINLGGEFMRFMCNNAANGWISSMLEELKRMQQEDSNLQQWLVETSDGKEVQLPNGPYKDTIEAILAAEIWLSDNSKNPGEVDVAYICPVDRKSNKIQISVMIPIRMLRGIICVSGEHNWVQVQNCRYINVNAYNEKNDIEIVHVCSKCLIERKRSTLCGGIAKVTYS